MKFKSPVLSEASGSIAGLTASHNRYGLYFRQRVIPVNPATGLQVAVRGFFGLLSTAWQSTLTAAQRAAWDLYAQNVTVTGPLGDQQNITGANMYIRCNVPRLQAGLPRVDDGPTEFSLGSFSAVSGTIVASTQVIGVTFTEADDWVDEDDAGLLVYTGLPQAPTINFFKGPFRYAGMIEGDSTTPPTSPASINTLDYTYTAAQIAFCRYLVSRADGRLSPVQLQRTVVA